MSDPRTTRSESHGARDESQEKGGEPTRDAPIPLSGASPPQAGPFVSLSNSACVDIFFHYS